VSRAEVLYNVVSKDRLRRLAGAALRHPLMRTLKAPLRSAWWRVRRRRTENPPIPPGVGSILFVCLGNICRSPFGAELAKQLLAERGRSDIRCSSAGIRPSQDNRSPDEACEVSATYGIGLASHRPQELTRALMESHDMVIVMEWRQLAELQQTYPEQADRIFLLSLFDDGARGGYERYNIADPFGQPVAAFEECYRRMERSLRRCLLAVLDPRTASRADA
jgi:protein-tyrosine-phosphatase